MVAMDLEIYLSFIHQLGHRLGQLYNFCYAVRANMDNWKVKRGNRFFFVNIFHSQNNDQGNTAQDSEIPNSCTIDIFRGLVPSNADPTRHISSNRRCSGSR